MKMVKRAIKEYTDFNIKKCRLPRYKNNNHDEVYNLYGLICDRKTNIYAQKALIEVGDTIKDILRFLNIDCREIEVGDPGWSNTIGLYNFEDNMRIKIIKDHYYPELLHVQVKSKDKERDERYTIVDGKYYDSNGTISLKYRGGRNISKESLEHGYKYELVDNHRGNNYIHCLDNKKYYVQFQANSIALKDNNEISSVIKNLTLPTNVEELFNKLTDNYIIKTKEPFHMELVQGKRKGERKGEQSDKILINNGVVSVYKITNDNTSIYIIPNDKDNKNYYIYDKKDDLYSYQVKSTTLDNCNRLIYNPTITINCISGDIKDAPSSEEIYTEASNAYQKSLGVIKKCKI